MKQELTLMALCAGLAFSAEAQHKWLPSQPQQAKHLRVANTILKHNFLQKNTRLRPTAIRQRVVAQTISGTEMIDSFHYTYSGTKGSYYNYNRIFDPGYSTEFVADIAPAFVTPEVMASNDVLADNIAAFYAGEAPESSVAYYNTSGSIDSAINTFGTNSRRMSMLYNDEGRITQYKEEFISSGSLIGGNLRKIAYTGGKIETDSIFNWSGGDWTFDQEMIYEYDSEGNITEITEAADGEESFNLYKFRYDAGGRLRATDYIMVIGLMSVTVASDTIGYTDGTDYLTFYQYMYGTDFGSFGYRIRQYPGMHAGPDSIKVDNFDDDVWVHQGTGHFTYNEFDNPTQLELVAAETEEPEEDMIDVMRFYYETYDDGISSNDDVTLSKMFSVFPNPFTNTINLAFKGTQNARMQIQLADISGRLILNSSKLLQQGNNSINVPELPAGIYLLNVKDEQGKYFTQKLVRE